MKSRSTPDVSPRGLTLVLAGVVGGPLFALMCAQVGAGAGSNGGDDWGAALAGAGIGLLVGGAVGISVTMAGFQRLVRQLRSSPADGRTWTDAWAALYAVTVVFAAVAVVLILSTDWHPVLVIYAVTHVYLVPLAILLRRRCLQRWHLPCV